MTKRPLHRTKVLTWGAHGMTFQISPCIHLAQPSVPSTTPNSHAWCTRDDFSDFTSHPFNMTKWQLHHTKVLTWVAREITFQISPYIHLVWPSVSCTTPKFSCEVHARWLFKCHLTSMQDDIWKLYNRKIFQIFIIWPWDIEEVTSNSKVLLQGACKMTFQMSPRIHLTWPSVSSTKVHARWLFKFHLASIYHDQVSVPPHQSSHARCS